MLKKSKLKLLTSRGTRCSKQLTQVLASLRMWTLKSSAKWQLWPNLKKARPLLKARAAKLCLPGVVLLTTTLIWSRWSTGELEVRWSRTRVLTTLRPRSRPYLPKSNSLQLWLSKTRWLPRFTERPRGSCRRLLTQVGLKLTIIKLRWLGLLTPMPSAKEASSRKKSVVVAIRAKLDPAQYPSATILKASFR